MFFLLIQQGKGMDGDHKINPGDVVTLCEKTLSLNSCITKMRFNKAKCASSTGGCSLWTTCTVDVRGYKYTKKVFVTAVFGKEWIWNFQESDRFQWCFVFFDPLFLCLQTSFCCSCVCAKLPHLKQQLCFKRLWQLLDWRNRKPFETKEYKETWFYTNTDTYQYISYINVCISKLNFIFPLWFPDFLVRSVCSVCIVTITCTWHRFAIVTSTRREKFPHNSSLCLAQVKLSHVPNILKLKSHFLKYQNPWLCKEWKTSQNSQIHILLGMQKGWEIQNKWRVSWMSRKNQELAFTRRESTVDGTAALGFSKWRWKPPKILSPILKAMWQRKSKSISGFFESNHRPMSSKEPENIRIIPGGVKNFAHSTIGFSRQSREEINFNCGNPRRQFWPRMIEFKPDWSYQSHLVRKSATVKTVGFETFRWTRRSSLRRLLLILPLIFEVKYVTSW